MIQGDEDTVRQIIGQTEKLQDVREIFVLDPVNSVTRELLMIKVAADVNNRGEIRDIADIYKAKIIDLSADMISNSSAVNESASTFLIR